MTLQIFPFSFVRLSFEFGQGMEGKITKTLNILRTKRGFLMKFSDVFRGYQKRSVA